MASTVSTALPSPTGSPEDTFDDVNASTTSELPVQITNAFSLVACLTVLISYFIFRRKNARLMERTSLVLAVSMASADLLLHVRLFPPPHDIIMLLQCSRLSQSINLFGYSDLPRGFVCNFFGGFLYAFPTLVSIFYSACIALNTQIVFVFSKRPGQTKLKYYIGVPIILSLCICKWLDLKRPKVVSHGSKKVSLL